jgi:hypothetical protein
MRVRYHYTKTIKKKKNQLVMFGIGTFFENVTNLGRFTIQTSLSKNRDVLPTGSHPSNFFFFLKKKINLIFMFVCIYFSNTFLGFLFYFLKSRDI